MNNLYSIALFLHVVGALGFFTVLGLEWTSVFQLRRATTVEQVRMWMRVAGGSGRVGMVAMLLLLLSGIYMMATGWGFVPWIGVTLGTILLMAVMMMAWTRPRMAAVAQAIDPAVTATQGGISPDLRQLLRHPLLWLGIQMRIATILGIVYLMTVKPDFVTSLFAIGAALLLGGIISLLVPGRGQPRAEPAM